MSILVINSSKNKNGNTVHLAKEVLRGKDFELLNLNDYHLAQLGEDSPVDQFTEVFEKIDAADTVVFGTPIYWHSMTGSLKLLIDRISEDITWENTNLRSKNIILVAQGAAPGKVVLDHCDFIFQNFCARIDMNYLGLVSNSFEAKNFLKENSK